jgi:methyl-accepting chemotaxis protein
MLVDRIQYWLLAIELGHFVLLSTIFLVALFAPIVLQMYSGDLTSRVVQVAAREFLVLHTRVWLPLLLAMAVLALHNIMISHRIAGPLWRIREIFRSVGEGDLSQRISLRRKDYLQHEARAANEMIEGLDERVHGVRERVAMVRQAWTRLRARKSHGEQDLTMIDAMSRAIESLESSLGEFQTGQGAPSRDAHKGDIHKEPEAPLIKLV